MIFFFVLGCKVGHFNMGLMETDSLLEPREVKELQLFLAQLRLQPGSLNVTIWSAPGTKHYKVHL